MPRSPGRIWRARHSARSSWSPAAIRPPRRLAEEPGLRWHQLIRQAASPTALPVSARTTGISSILSPIPRRARGPPPDGRSASRSVTWMATGYPTSSLPDRGTQRAVSQSRSLEVSGGGQSGVAGDARRPARSSPTSMATAISTCSHGDGGRNSLSSTTGRAASPMAPRRRTGGRAEAAPPRRSPM
jgi:hypothetical protein